MRTIIVATDKLAGIQACLLAGPGRLTPALKREGSDNAFWIDPDGDWEPMLYHLAVQDAKTILRRRGRALFAEYKARKFWG
jgi:hypothetical protein